MAGKRLKSGKVLIEHRSSDDLLDEMKSILMDADLSESHLSTLPTDLSEAICDAINDVIDEKLAESIAHRMAAKFNEHLREERSAFAYGTRGKKIKMRVCFLDFAHFEADITDALLLELDMCMPQTHAGKKIFAEAKAKIELAVAKVWDIVEETRLAFDKEERET